MRTAAVLRIGAMAGFVMAMARGAWGGPLPMWGRMGWDATVSDATDLKVEVRVSDRADFLGNYVEVNSPGWGLAVLSMRMLGICNVE